MSVPERWPDDLDDFLSENPVKVSSRLSVWWAQVRERVAFAIAPWLRDIVREWESR